MKNKILSIFVYVISFILISSSAVFAADISTVKSSSTSNELVSKLSSKDYNELKLQAAKFAKENQQNNNSTLNPLAAAPKLSSISVYEIYSDQYENEYISNNQMLTKNSYANITGAEYIVTLDWGYGTSPFAKMDNNNLNCLEVDSVNANGGVNQPGTVTVGFLRFWDANTYRTGEFTYQNQTNGYQSLYTSLGVE